MTTTTMMMTTITITLEMKTWDPKMKEIVKMKTTFGIEGGGTIEDLLRAMHQSGNTPRSIEGTVS
jgi:hypothetical protein